MKHFIACSGTRGSMPDYCEPFEHESEAVDSLLDLVEIDEDTIIIVDTLNRKETKIVDRSHFQGFPTKYLFDYPDSPEDHPERAKILKLAFDVYARYEITDCRDLIHDLRTNGYCDLPHEGYAHPVLGSEYLEVTECDCDEPHVHSESGVDWCQCSECAPEEDED